MYCPKCGNPISDNANVCGDCGYRTGTPAPNAPAAASPSPSATRPAKARRKLPLSTIIASAVALLAVLALAAVLVLRGGFSAGTASATPGFTTPEDAIKYFSQALAANDFEKAMQACAIYEQAAGTDFAGMVDRRQTAMLYTQLAPATSDLFVDMNCAAVKGKFAVQVKMMIYSLFIDEGLDGESIPADRAYAESLMQTIDTQQLGDLKLLRIDPPMKDALEKEKIVKNFTATAKISGADELTERIALYEFNGQIYMGGYTLLHYEDGWKIGYFVSSLAGTNAMATLEKVSLADYAALQ